jgi:hypothetical protein
VNLGPPHLTAHSRSHVEPWRENYQEKRHPSVISRENFRRPLTPDETLTLDAMLRNSTINQDLDKS